MQSQNPSGADLQETTMRENKSAGMRSFFMV
jgi:hypothetical protein